MALSSSSKKTYITSIWARPKPGFLISNPECFPTAAAAAKSLQSCQTLRPHWWKPTRLPRPWDSPGKNTGVGCHFLLQCMKVKSESEVVQLCPTLSNPMDCSPPGSSVHGIFQARAGSCKTSRYTFQTGYAIWKIYFKL